MSLGAVADSSLAYKKLGGHDAAQKDVDAGRAERPHDDGDPVESCSRIAWREVPE